MGIAMNRAGRVGLSADAVNRLVGWLVIGTFVGGHLGYGLFYQPTEYLGDPIKFLYVWEGLWSMGGIVTCLALCLIFFKRENMKVWPYLDCLTIGFAMGSVGWIGHVSGGHVDYPIMVMMASTAVVGSYIGAELTGRVTLERLIMTLGMVLLAVGPILMWRGVM